MTQSKDEVGLILLGSEDTNNPLAEDELYSHIEIRHRLQLARWEMVNTIKSFKKGTTVDGDWLDAIIVAADFIKGETEGKKIKEKKIVILTNFRSEVSEDQVDDVISALQKENIQVIVIGPQVYRSDTQGTKLEGDQKSLEQEQGEALILKITDSVEGSVICSFEDAMFQLRYFGAKKVKSIAWNTIMDIGSNIKIPISGYKKIAETKKFIAHDIVIPSKLKTASTSSSLGQATQESIHHMDEELLSTESQNTEALDESQKFDNVDKDHIYRAVDDETTPVDNTELIEGYMFGTTLVPVTEDDKPELIYVSGPRCLSVLGFTDEKNVPLYYVKGQCTQVFPRKEENSMRAFAALIQAMHSKDMVAIARKVYYKNSRPVICALFPMITPELQCFNLVELPFAENVKTQVFPPLVIDKNKPTDEQLSAVDELIMSMNLMEDDDDAETGEYDPLNTPDPYEQHFYDLVSKKVLNGELYISGSDVDEAVKQLLSPKPEILEAAKPAVKKIKELFTLTKVVPKEGARNAAADIFKQDTKPLDIADVELTDQITKSKDVTPHVGTVRPDEDFALLLKNGVSLNKACSLLEQVIKDMVLRAFDADDFKKPLKCLQLMRKTCASTDPKAFNDWLIQFKKELPSEKIGFWQLIVKDGAGLITTSESSLSRIDEEEAKKFMQMDEVNDVALPSQGVDEDLDDLVSHTIFFLCILAVTCMYF